MSTNSKPESAHEKAYEQWLKTHPLCYTTGERILPGDFVDFGFDGKFTNGPSLDLADGPWLGEVVRTEGVDVVVDTKLNSMRRFPIDRLRFAGHSPDNETQASNP